MLGCRESAYEGVGLEWRRGTDLEGLDIRETDTLTSKCRSSDVICFSLLGCRVSVRDRAVLRNLVLWNLYSITVSSRSGHSLRLLGVRA